MLSIFVSMSASGLSTPPVQQYNLHGTAAMYVPLTNFSRLKGILKMLSVLDKAYCSSVMADNEYGAIQISVREHSQHNRGSLLVLGGTYLSGRTHFHDMLAFDTEMSWVDFLILTALLAMHPGSVLQDDNATSYHDELLLAATSLAVYLTQIEYVCTATRKQFQYLHHE